jgi:hypothetical protein
VRRALVALVLLAVDCQPPQIAWAACRRIAAAAVEECSGIVRSRRQPGVLWVHNDSGDSARFFALDTQGALLAEVRVDRARNVDWEDIATDDDGHLYLGDFGNNRNARRDLCVYVVDEPDVAGAGAGPMHVPVLRVLRFRYADQTAWPDSARLNFDCEAMYWDAGALWLLTKHRSDIATTLYRLDPMAAAEQVLAPIAHTDIGSPVTAADCSPDGGVLALLSYQYIHLFERDGTGGAFFDGRVDTTLIEGRQCEGLCFDGDRLLFTNEQRDIHCLPLDFLRTHDRYIPEPPRAEVPGVEPLLDGRPAEWWGDAGRLRFDRFAPTAGGDARATPVAVRVGWAPAGLLVHAFWRPATGGRQPVLYVMLGPAGAERPCLRPGQAAWGAVWSADTLALRPEPPEEGQPPCAPPLAAPAPPVTVTRRDGADVAFEALVPVAGMGSLEAGTALSLNVVLRGADGAGAESAWSAVLDMQPLGNPLLWGHAVLAPARAGSRR